MKAEALFLTHAYTYKNGEAMSETSTIPGTTAGVIGAVVLAVIGLITGWFKYRAADKSEIKRRIEETEEALRVALENGMVTDAKTLSRRLDRLYRMYRRDGSRPRMAAGGTESEAGSPPVTSSQVAKILAVALGVSVAACIAVLASGCSSLFGKGKVEYVVLGERINIVKPGETVVVPDLIPPAKRWYMVDNVGLEGWLGIGDMGARGE